MRKTALYYNDAFLEHLVPIGHPENKNRIRFILDKIKKSDLKGLKINSAKPANYNILRLGHSDKYLNWLDRLKYSTSTLPHYSPDEVRLIDRNNHTII